MRVYPVSESELNDLRFYALLSFTVIGIPFLILAALLMVSRIKRETKFDDAHI